MKLATYYLRTGAKGKYEEVESNLISYLEKECGEKNIKIKWNYKDKFFCTLSQVYVNRKLKEEGFI